jgi:glycosyltransferase involved in cell wall biosynthesis
MIIAIAAEHANSARPTGVEHYTRQLILALSRIDQRNKYVLYIRTAPQRWFSELPQNFTVRHLPSRIAWTQLRLSLAMFTDKPDALLVPSFSMPWIHPKKTIVTIHDLAWLLFPETEEKLQRWSLAVTHTFAKWFASNLIAVSNSTKLNLVSSLGVSESKIKVIHHGFYSEGQEQNTETRINTCAQPIIVCLGTLQPRKNLCRLIDAFSMMKEQHGFPHLLVLAGRKGWMCDEILSRVATTRDVIYIGYIEDRLALIKGAALLVQPSVYEGFGLSVLDAFAERVPVACSNTSSLPEVVGEAAELFDPYSVTSMCLAMSNVLIDPIHANLLAQRGWERLKQFTWDTCASKTLSLLSSQHQH